MPLPFEGREVLGVWQDHEADKGAWWMPWLPEAKKDAISCEKPR